MAEPQWLSPDEMRLWRSFIAINAGTTKDIDADLKADSNLSRDDYEVLVHLSEADGHRVMMSELSDRVFNSRSRLSQRIDRMETRGLVAREQCPDDKRSTFATLTPAGLKAIALAAPMHVKSVRRHLLDHLSPAEVTQLGQLLTKLATERAKNSS